VRFYTTATSFVRAQTLYDHLLDYDLATIFPPGGKVRPGDIVFYNLHGLSLDHGIDHTQIVTNSVTIASESTAPISRAPLEVAFDGGCWSWRPLQPPPLSRTSSSCTHSRSLTRSDSPREPFRCQSSLTASSRADARLVRLPSGAARIAF
jgi:hypothetical protein